MCLHFYLHFLLHFTILPVHINANGRDTSETSFQAAYHPIPLIYPRTQLTNMQLALNFEWIAM